MVAVAALLCVAWVAIDAPPQAPLVRARPMSDIAHAIVDDARRRSPLIDRLLAEIDASDLIVFIEFQDEPTSRPGRTRLISANDAARFVAVTVNLALPHDRRAEILAHELQHVVEIAHAPDVRDDAGMRRLFGGIGWCGGASSFETAAAIQVENTVRRELWVSTSGTKPKPGAVKR